MKVRIVVPASVGSLAGNSVTAERWAKLIAQLGHTVNVGRDAGGDEDVLVALHARRCFEVVAAAHMHRPERPIVVALTGTDLYQDLPGSPEAQQALDWADRIIVLQPLARESLPPPLQAKTRVILQSAEAPRDPPPPDPASFEVCVVGHLRPVKDPFCAAAAARRLPPASRLRVTHVGGALSDDYAEQARAEERENPRYRWLGELPRAETLRVIARARLLVVTSRSEGGANVVSEALAVGTPVVSSRIPGSLGILGAEYPGTFAPGDPAELAALLQRLETDPGFYNDLRGRCAALAPLVDPDRERAAWEALLAELTAVSGGSGG